MDTPAPEAALLDLQRTVQRKLGRCLLRLQQVEMLLKALAPHAEVAGPPDQLQTIRDAQVARARKKTMGGLVRMLTDGTLASNATDVPDEDGSETAEGPWVRLRFQVVFDAEQFEAAKAWLKELVDLRNQLVHHFLQRFKIRDMQGCTAADAYLDASYETIDAHYLTLLAWARDMKETRALMASIITSETFEDLWFNGVSPDG